MKLTHSPRALAINLVQVTNGRWFWSLVGPDAEVLDSGNVRTYEDACRDARATFEYRIGAIKTAPPGPSVMFGRSR